MHQFGVLILHGFTASRATVAALVPQAEALGLPWRLPQLRGHWTTPNDLHGVSYDDMYADASAALDDLRTEAERVLVVGLSVGGTIGLDLAAQRPDAMERLAVLAPALRFANKLSAYSPLISRVLRTFPAEPTSGFSDQSLMPLAGNYDSFPTRTFASIFLAGKRVEAALSQIHTPLLVLGATNDRVIPPEVSGVVYQQVSSRPKQLAWFNRTGHEMLLDCEAEAIADRVGQFLRAGVAQRPTL